MKQFKKYFRMGAAALLLVLSSALILPINSQGATRTVNQPNPVDQLNDVTPGNGMHVSQGIDQTGGIQGTVSADGGGALSGIEVHYYQYVSAQNPGYIGFVTTNGSGVYSIAGLSAGNYRLHFIDPSGDYQSEYYNDAGNLGDGSNIPVSTTTVTGIDAGLALAGHVTGIVTASGGGSLSNIQVQGHRWNGAFFEGSESTSTAGDGSYDLGGLPAGTYRIHFSDPAGNYAQEYYNNATTQATGDDVSVSVGATTTNISAALEQAGNITGQVSDEQSTDLLQNITVRAYLWTGSGWNIALGTSTDASGNFDLQGLIGGSYRIEFYDHAGAYRGEFYDDAEDQDSATSVSLSPGGSVSSINAALVPIGGISGTVTADVGGTLLNGITVRAFRWSEGSWQWFKNATTDVYGDYELTELTAGEYRLRFRDYGGNYLPEYFNDSSNIEGGTTIPVIAGSLAAGTDASLALAGHITGIVTDAFDDLELGDIAVTAFRWNSFDMVWEPVNTVFSDYFDGSYDIGELFSGLYRVEFYDDFFEYYQTVYYNDEPSLDMANNISVSAGSTTGGIDAEMAANPQLTATSSGANVILNWPADHPSSSYQIYYAERPHFQFDDGDVLSAIASSPNSWTHSGAATSGSAWYYVVVGESPYAGSSNQVGMFSMPLEAQE